MLGQKIVYVDHLPYVLCVCLSVFLFLSNSTLGKGRIESPLETVNFLDDWKRILESRFTAASVEECMDSAGSVCNIDNVALLFQTFLYREANNKLIYLFTLTKSKKIILFFMHIVPLVHNKVG